MKIGTDWASVRGCLGRLGYLAIAVVLFAMAVDATNSDGTRIVAAIFVVGMALDNRLSSLSENQERISKQLTQATLERAGLR